MLAVSTEFPASVKADSVLTCMVSRAMKLGPDDCYQITSMPTGHCLGAFELLPPAENYNCLIECPLPRRKCLGALAPSKSKHTVLGFEQTLRRKLMMVNCFVRNVSR